jgi:hypothetical protein
MTPAPQPSPIPLRFDFEDAGFRVVALQLPCEHYLTQTQFAAKVYSAFPCRYAPSF